MKEKILKLRSEGRTYRQIKNELNCSLSTISFHCGDGQKNKSRIRTNKNRKEILVSKIQAFRNKSIRDKYRDFQRREFGHLKSKQSVLFSKKDLIKKIGKEPLCYLTGKKINLYEPKTYQLDHIIPASKGGDNSLDNLGILRREINLMKHDFTVDELIGYCKEILEHNGYKIIRISG